MRLLGKRTVQQHNTGASLARQFPPQPTTVSIYNTPLTPTPTPINPFFSYIREWFPYYSTFILLGVNVPSVPVYQ